MLILFDHGAPRGVARALRGHTVITAKARGWDRLTNGALLNVAEESAVDLLFNTVQRIRYQRDLTGRKIAIVVLAGTTKWSRVQLHLEHIAAVVNAATPGKLYRNSHNLLIKTPTVFCDTKRRRKIFVAARPCSAKQLFVACARRDYFGGK